MKFDKYIAHRGLHNKELWAPENSSEAFRRAVDMNFGIELDVHLTKDGQIVVFHDDNLKRMTGLNKRITDLTMNELKQLRLNGTSERIPSLAEVLKIVDGRVLILIEIKNTSKIGELERRLLKLMKSYKGIYAIQSFNPFRLYWFRKHAPKVFRGQLISCFPNSKKNLYRKLISKPIVWKYISKPAFLSYDLRCITIETLILAIQNGCQLFTWTANTPELLKEAEKFSDSIIFEDVIPTK